MPLYHYKCNKCGLIFEALQAMNDEPLKTHDDHWSGMPARYCNGVVERIPTAASLKFVGAGFYVNDYRGKP